MPADVTDTTSASPQAQPGTGKPVAVIDIGTTSIRMAIAEIRDDESVRILERLSQGVSLGKDTFTKGFIARPTIGECVRVLRSYRQRLEEYQISLRQDQVRVVATSAVSEARNRLSLLDRIYSATGFQVDVIGEAELHRAMYLGIQPLLDVQPGLRSSRTMLVEVGGGSTDLLVLQGKDVIYAHTFRLGSLRLRETLEAHRAPTSKLRSIMESHIERTVEELRQRAQGDGKVEMVATGGDVRFAAAHLLTKRSRSRLDRIEHHRLQQFTDQMLGMTQDELVYKFHLSVPDAETLAPALLTYCELARGFRLEEILVSDFNLRDALLTEMAVGEVWAEDFTNQIIRSALDIARKFRVDVTHAQHVAALSRQLFVQMQEVHQLDQRHQLILYVAALLHEVGLFVNDRAYHKHSMYLISNSQLFGVGARDLLLMALVARYHRRSSPKPGHQGYATLDRENRVAVAKMGALLRLADSLDESRSQRIQQIDCNVETDRLIVGVRGVDDLSLEQLAVQQRGPLFEEIFGMQVLLRRRRSSS